MRWSVKVCRIFGIPVRIHLTFLLLLLFIALRRPDEAAGLSGLRGVLLVLAIFACVVAHELAHSLVARSYGVRVRSITLFPIGGVASMEAMPERPMQEILMAVAGPAISLFLSAAFFATGLALYGAEVSTIFGLTDHMLIQLAWANALLAAFNLLPAFPMDGGRMLRGLLAAVIGPLRATRIAAAAGQILAVMMVFGGALSGQWLLALIGVFIFFGGQAEEHATAMRVFLSHEPAHRAMLSSPEPVGPEETLAGILDRLCHGTQEDFPVVDDGKFLGLLPKAVILRALKERPPETPVSELMVSPTAAAPDTPLSEIHRMMRRSEVGVVPVVEGDRVVGLVTLEQIGKYHLLCGRE